MSWLKTTDDAREYLDEEGWDTRHLSRSDLYTSTPDRRYRVQLPRENRDLRPHERAAIENTILDWIRLCKTVASIAAVFVLVFALLVLSGLVAI